MTFGKPASQVHSLMQTLHVLIQCLDLCRLDDVNVEVSLDVQVPGDILAIRGDGLLDHFLWIEAVFLAVLLM